MSDAHAWVIGWVYRIEPLGWYHLLIFGVLVPLAAMRSGRRLVGPGRPLPNRVRHFRSVAIMLVFFGLLSWLTAREHVLSLFPARWPPLVGCIAAAILYAAAVILMRPRWRKAVMKRSRTVYLFMPSTPGERSWWLIVAVLAGISEEITWRGVQTALLASVFSSELPAVALAAVTFGIAHAAQGWKSGAVIVVFALGFHGLVWLSGSLYAPMAVHVAYDITAGLAYGRLGRELGYVPADPATA